MGILIRSPNLHASEVILLRPPSGFLAERGVFYVLQSNRTGGLPESWWGPAALPAWAGREDSERVRRTAWRGRIVRRAQEQRAQLTRRL